MTVESNKRVIVNGMWDFITIKISRREILWIRIQIVRWIKRKEIKGRHACGLNRQNCLWFDWLVFVPSLDISKFHCFICFCGIRNRYKYTLYLNRCLRFIKKFIYQKENSLLLPKLYLFYSLILIDPIQFVKILKCEWVYHIIQYNHSIKFCHIYIHIKID